MNDEESALEVLAPGAPPAASAAGTASTVIGRVMASSSTRSVTDRVVRKHRGVVGAGLTAQAGGRELVDAAAPRRAALRRADASPEALLSVISLEAS